jgi:transketolase
MTPIDDQPDLAELQLVARTIRRSAVEMVAPQGFGYLGQALSAAEQYAAVYGWAARRECDRLVVSPGHYVIAALAAAVATGRMAPELLATYGQDGSAIEAIGTERTPGVDYTCGSLGQGLSAAVGFAIADRIDNSRARTYAFLSDGELEEGQVWEAAMFAGHHRLQNLVVLIDANDSQVDGPISEITTLEPIAAKWEAFGWNAHDVDGHSLEAITDAIAAAGTDSRPTVVICRTSTRTGLDCLPDDADGHFIKLSPDLARAALAELGGPR